VPEVHADFADLAEEFEARVAHIVWAVMATVDRANRPRTRIVHPVWGGAVGWVGTRPESLKMRHLNGNPWVSLTYFDSARGTVAIEARAVIVEDAAAKRRAWELFSAPPEPYGYDPAAIWKHGPDGADFGVLRLDAWRVELTGTPELSRGVPAQGWERAEV
jgi:hypothetical protein